MTALRGVIFDLDGTLIDSLPDVVSALNGVLDTAGRRAVTIAEGLGIVGGGAEPLLQKAFELTGAPLDGDELPRRVRDFLQAYAANPVEKTVLFEGALDMLDGLAAEGMPIGICTNKPHEMALRVLDALDIRHRFASCIGKGMLGFNKPDRRHYDAVAREMGVATPETVYIGDSRTDVETARAAGVPVVLVTFGYSAEPIESLGADAIADRLSDLRGTIERLMA